MESGVNRWYDLWWREGGTAGTGHVTYIYNMQVILATIILGMFDLGQRSSNPQSKQDCWSRIQLELKSFVLKFWKWILNFRIKKWHQLQHNSCQLYILCVMNTDFIQQHKDDRHSDESKNDRQWGNKYCESLRRDLQLCHNLQNTEIQSR